MLLLVTGPLPDPNEDMENTSGIELPPLLRTDHIFDVKSLILMCMSSLKCLMRIKILLIER